MGAKLSITAVKLLSELSSSLILKHTFRCKQSVVENNYNKLLKTILIFQKHSFHVLVIVVELENSWLALPGCRHIAVIQLRRTIQITVKKIVL